MKLTREKLQEIREVALAEAEKVGDNLWRRAYKALASAADTLDAMEARTE